MSPLLRARTEVIAHRGLHTRYRENTLDAFEGAVAAGADAVELDVHASVDGGVIVHHDQAIAHADGQSFVIAQTPTVELLKLGVPTLGQVLDRFVGRAKIYIEVKAPGIELLVARVVRESEAEAAIHSFDHRIVRKIRDLVPGIQTGILTVGRPINPTRLLADAAANDYWPQSDFVDADLVAEVHQAGGRVIVWTANKESEWVRLIEMNVDAICTDRPDLLQAWVEGQPG